MDHTETPESLDQGFMQQHFALVNGIQLTVTTISTLQVVLLSG
jgi:hypothetical protein